MNTRMATTRTTTSRTTNRRMWINGTPSSLQTPKQNITVKMHYWINFVSFNYTEHFRCKKHVLLNINSNLYKAIVKLLQCKIKNLWLIFTKYWCKHVTKWCCTFKCIRITIYCKQTFIRVQEIFTRFARAMLVQEIFASFTRALTLQIFLAINQSLLNGFKKQQNAWRNNLSPQTSLSPVCKIEL